MQAGYLLVKKCALAIVIHDIVGNGQALLPGSLGGENGLDFGPRKPAARHDPLDLQAFRAINDQDAVATFTVLPRFDQQRHRQYHVRR